MQKNKFAKNFMNMAERIRVCPEKIERFVRLVYRLQTGALSVEINW